MELAVTVQGGARDWLVHGPDLNGAYGGLQGTGGLEAVYNGTTGATTGILSDLYGHTVATVFGLTNTLSWNPARAGGYGVLPESGPAQPLDGVQDLAVFLAWRGHYVDATGYYYLGARYYDPSSGTFLSSDPLGLDSDRTLYAFCNGDPINGFDPTGRVSSQVWDTTRTEVSVDWNTATSLDFWDRIDPTNPNADPFVRSVTLANTASSWGNISVDYQGNTGGLLNDAGQGAGDSYNQISNESTQRMFYYHDQLGRSWTSSFIAASFSDPVLSATGINGIMEGGFGNTSTGQVLSTEVRVQRTFSGISQAAVTTIGFAESYTAETTAAETTAADTTAQDIERVCAGNCFAAGTKVVEADGGHAIESVEEGQRVLTSSEESQNSSTEVDPATWKRVRMHMRNPYGGDRMDIVFLRPDAWLIERNCVPGNGVWLTLQEISVDGWATVDAVEACPPVASGPGRVVTGTITHLNSYVMRLELESGEVLNPTNTHRLFSATRQDWVPARALVPGEVLQTEHGVAKVASIEQLSGTQRVYNLEVETDHRYFVGNAEVLSHNASGCPPDFYLNLENGKGMYATVDKSGVVDFVVEAGPASPVRGGKCSSR
ncbi:intein/RHS repeat-associated protein [Chthoniobacter flavus]|nr:intein/RHS repeat-associated protein [Chthoniobacter flavus]